MTSSHQPGRPRDDYSWLIVLAFVAAALPATLLGLTSAGLAAAIAVLFMSWFFGRNSVPAAIFIVAAIAALGGVLQGVSLAFFSDLLGQYASAYRSLESGKFAASIWSNAVLRRDAWLASGPLGAMLGAGLVLILEDRRNSSLTALAEGRATVKKRAPAPFAYLMRWWIALHPAGLRGRTVLGSEVRTGKRTTISDRDLNRHTFIVGTVGRGKTVSTFNILQSAAQRKIPILYVDGKAQLDLVPHFRALAEKHGRKFYYWNAADPLGSCAYDPLQTGDFTSKADRIMALREWTEPHYELVAQGFIQTVFKSLEATGHRAGLLETAQFLSVNALLGLVRRTGFSDAKKQELANEIMEQQEAEKVGVASLKKEILNLANSSLRPLFDVRKAEKEGRLVLNLATARQEGAIVYIGLPALAFPKTASKIARVVINDVKATASVTTDPWITAFDEFSAIAAAVLQVLNMGRSFGLCGVLACQSFADLEACDPINPTAFARRVLASTNTYLIHSLNDPEDGETGARLIGTQSQIEYTAQTVGGQATGAASARITKGFKVHPDELKQIATGEAVLVNKNDFTVSHIRVRDSGV